MSLYRCAACGSPNVVTDTQAGGVKYNYLKGAIGTVALGAGGAAAGLSSDSQKVFKCPDCGVTLTYAMPQEMKNLIDLGVMSADVRKNLTYMGVPVTWDFILSKYKNIESGLGDRMAAEEAEEKRLKALKGMELLKSKGTATKEEFDAAVDQMMLFEHRMGYDRGKYDAIYDDEFTPERPTTLAEYLMMCQAVEIFIENYFKYLEIPEDSDKEYRGLCLLFGLRGYIPFYLHTKLCEKYDTNNSYLLSNESIGKCIIDEFVLGNPFLSELCSVYIRSLAWTTNEEREAQFRKGVRNCEDTIVGNQIMREILYRSSKWIEPKPSGMWIKPCKDMGRPYFMVKDGALFYWDATFKTSPLHDDDSDDFIPTIKKNYFMTYPEKKAEYNKMIRNYESIVSIAKEKEATIKNHKERIEYLKGQINGANYEISVLQNKVFGRKQAEEQIAYHQYNISVFENECRYLESEIKRIENEPKPMSKREHDILLLKKFDCFIVWHRVEENQ